jgi:two component regulator three Y motif family protein
MDNQKVSKAKSRLILQHIRENISQEDQWQVFQENFDLIHKDFFKKLKELYPQLTPTDLRLAVLIRLNYTSKEIATMQNVSLRGVETARYRLRKKLQLAEENNLYEFFAQFN